MGHAPHEPRNLNLTLTLTLTLALALTLILTLTLTQARENDSIRQFLEARLPYRSRLLPFSAHTLTRLTGSRVDRADGLCGGSGAGGTAARQRRPGRRAAVRARV